MRAWLLPEQTGIEKLVRAEVPDPVAGPGEVVLRMRFAGLNPADRYLAEKQYPARPALPHILGRDGLGTVVELGPGVTEVALGDRLAILRGDVGGNKPGTFAEKVAVPVQNLVRMPEDWSEPESAGATLVFLTAFQALTMWGTLPRQTNVLITGATGGVGAAATQLAAAMGHVVIGLTRSPDKVERLKQIGAEVVLDPQDHCWPRELLKRLDPKRVDLAIDNIGGRLLPQVIETLGEHGRVSLVGRLAGPVPDFNTATLFFRRLRLGGVAVGGYTNSEARSAWEDVVRLMGRLRPLVDSTFEFEKLPAAFERLAAGPMGKVLLRIKQPVQG